MAHNASARARLLSRLVCASQVFRVTLMCVSCVDAVPPTCLLLPDICQLTFVCARCLCDGFMATRSSSNAMAHHNNLYQYSIHTHLTQSHTHSLSHCASRVFGWANAQGATARRGVIANFRRRSTLPRVRACARRWKVGHEKCIFSPSVG